MKYLSMDHSLSNTGICVGTMTRYSFTPNHVYSWETKKVGGAVIQSDMSRMSDNAHNIIRAIEEYSPDLIFIEEPTGSQNNRSAISYAATIKSIAWLKAVSTYFNYRLHTVKAKYGKQIVTGSRLATKHQILDWAVRSYPNLPYRKTKKGSVLINQHHIADAIAIAYAGWHIHVK